MWQWIIQNGNEIVVLVTIITFVVSVAALSFSAYRYVSIRRDELKNKQYEKYHKLMRDISQGHDEGGLLKLVSQRAFIFELRHFPEYGELTIRLLESLLGEWREDHEKSTKLTFEIQDTINALRK